MKLAVIGLGKLGAPLAAVLARQSHVVYGADKSPEVVQAINLGSAPVPEPDLQEYLLASPVRAYDEVGEAVSQADMSFVIVPTPSKSDGTFDASTVVAAVEEIGQALRDRITRHVVVIVSTVMPGTTDGDVRTALERSSGRKVGDRLGLCYSPEFIALGSVIENMENPDMVLIGESAPWAGEQLQLVQRSVTRNRPPVVRMPIVNAEIAKLAVNAYVTMKLSFANSLAELCEEVPGGDAHQVLAAIAYDRRIGGLYLKPGAAFGGPCFPRDSIAYAALGHEYDTELDLAHATTDINDRQVWRLADALMETSPGPFGVLGLSYKTGTPVSEASAGVRLANFLTMQGAGVAVYDPLVKDSPELEDRVRWASSVNEVLQTCRMVVITTPWPEFKRDIETQIDHFPDVFIIDCWGQLPEDRRVFHVGRYSEG